MNQGQYENLLRELQDVNENLERLIVTITGVDENGEKKIDILAFQGIKGVGPKTAEEIMKVIDGQEA